MNIVSFPEQTAVYGSRQREYRPLPAHLAPDGKVTCCWSLSWRERLQVLLTGRIWHQILTFHRPLQPQLLSVEKPKL